MPRAPSPLARYGAIAGSDSWLRYAWTTRDDRVPVAADALPYPRRERALLDRGGRVLAVPREAAVSLLGDEPLLLRLARAPRFATSDALGNPGDRPLAMRWRLPASGRTGTAFLAPHASVVGFGPDASWVTATTVRRGGGVDTNLAPVDRLERVSTSGQRIDLGIPFPEGAPYTVITGESGVVAYSTAGDGGDHPPDGRIRFRAWEGGAWRTLNPGDPPQGEITCSTASARLLACDAVGADRRRRALVLRLPGGTRAVLAPPPGVPQSCATTQVATAEGFLGITQGFRIDGRACPAGRLSQRSAVGATTLSDRVYDPFHAPVLAFGRIVVAERREHRLLALETVDGEPQVLVGR
ncbi:hypothetical protein [Amnibacterium setariae]|uniref:Uncharacterized protein n=1 Tax=Amnibacterium setariae TaxID=2306585 RepID=A0A3A1U688_9MICO|nr:hypothetical protein [Amnibacterium setariae]RIX30528.1 hypothetical protein D1781_03645 [Amnibacterium setariae]